MIPSGLSLLTYQEGELITEKQINKDLSNRVEKLQDRHAVSVPPQNSRDETNVHALPLTGMIFQQIFWQRVTYKSQAALVICRKRSVLSSGQVVQSGGGTSLAPRVALIA